MPLEQEIRHEPLAAHSHKRKEHIGGVSLCQGQDRSDDHHNHTGDNTEKKSRLGHSAYDAVLLAHRARLCNALRARKVKTEIDEHLSEGHERHDVGIERVPLRRQNTRQIRQRDQRKEIFNDLEAVLPYRVFIKQCMRFTHTANHRLR